MNWSKITRFCFTYAMPDGAWLEDASGYRNWESFATIQKQLGQLWIDAQLRKTGWMTGCWITVGGRGE
jgi:hypothetical protein